MDKRRKYVEMNRQRDFRQNYLKKEIEKQGDRDDAQEITVF